MFRKYVGTEDSKCSLVLTMFSFPEYFMVRKDETQTQGVHLGVDLLVLSEVGNKLHKGNIRFAALFPEVVKYCGQYRGRGTKAAANKKPDPCDFSPKDGLLTLQILVYHSMANFSDLNGDTNMELKPLWNDMVGINAPDKVKWNFALHDYGSFLLGYQNTEVSGMCGEEYSIHQI
jgi:hypothetical protein